MKSNSITTSGHPCGCAQPADIGTMRKGNKNQTDGATAIATPVRVDRNTAAGKCFLHDDNGGWLADCHSKHVEGLAHAVNEHAALKAVAEAAERCPQWLGKMIADGAHLNSVLPGDCIRTLQRLETALAALRGGKGEK